MLERQDEAATRIQSTYRGRRSRKVVRGAQLRNAHAEAEKAEKRQASRNKFLAMVAVTATVRLQTAWRAKSARERVKKLRQEAHAEAERIEQERFLEQERIEQDRMQAEIQAGIDAEKGIGPTLSSEVAAHLQKRTLDEEIDEAATRIQKLHRGRLDRTRVSDMIKEELKKMNEAALAPLNITRTASVETVEDTPTPRPAAPARRVRCLHKAMLRADFEQGSQRVGTLGAGAEEEVLEARELPDGTERLRLADGWVSMLSKSGARILEDITHNNKAKPSRKTSPARSRMKSPAPSRMKSPGPGSVRKQRAAAVPAKEVAQRPSSRRRRGDTHMPSEERGRDTARQPPSSSSRLRREPLSRSQAERAAARSRVATEH